jgi:predicted ABC-type sugar transport system permease subunit
MKKILLTFLQFLLFLILFAIGSVLHPFNLRWVATAAAGTSRFFIADGLLLSIGVFLAILAVQALRKRTCDSPWTVLSFVLAVAMGYALKLGFVTKDLN